MDFRSSRRPIRIGCGCLTLSAAPYDEALINADDLIIRRIDPVQHIILDQNRNCRRISSKAYKPSSGPDAGMSVDIEALIVAAGVVPQAFVTTPKFTGSVSFAASAIRALGLWVGYEPIPGNPHHGEVWGNPQANKFTSAQNRALTAGAQWYVQIPNVELA